MIRERAVVAQVAVVTAEGASVDRLETAVRGRLRRDVIRDRPARRRAGRIEIGEGRDEIRDVRVVRRLARCDPDRARSAVEIERIR